MTNRDIIILVNVGVLNTTALDLPAADAYKLVIFKRAVRKQLEEIIAREQEIDGNAALLEELHNEEITLACKTMSYDSFHALAAENRSVAVTNDKGEITGRYAPFAIFEEALEGVLWRAPENE